MKCKIIIAAGVLLLAAAIAPSNDQRADLLPKLQPGQILTYLVRFRSDKNVKTESGLVLPLAPADSKTDTRALLRIQVLDLQQTGGRLTIHARCEFLVNDAGEAVPTNALRKRQPLTQPIKPEEKSVDFTISSEGFAEKITGLDALSPDQQQAWQEWLARFAMAWALPAPGAKIGEKWKTVQPEPAPSPIAALGWTSDSSYVRDEPCAPAQLSASGEVTPPNASDTCAVLLTAAKLVQKSSPKDATPEAFKLHQLRTMGTAKGSNEIITYISLTTGLVVRATENASQQMDVIVAKADGSNAVRYNVDAKSQLEVFLLTQAPPQH